ILSYNEIKPLHSNTDAMAKLPPPKDVKTLRAFLGKVNYYQRFLPNRATLLYPLYQLLRKNVAWVWTDECQEAFEKVKTLLTSSPFLKIFDPSRRTKLYTDASRRGIGAILKQIDGSVPKDQQEVVVAYFSKSLQPFQTRYSVTELELLAI